MSFATWAKEFYPFPAVEATHAYAAEHSLKKWIGLREANLAAHGLRKASYSIVGEGHGGVQRTQLVIDYYSCSLCRRFIEEDDLPTCCDRCPLSIVRGGVPCAIEMADELRSPYTAWTHGGDPEPMIMWLHKAAEYHKEQSK